MTIIPSNKKLRKRSKADYYPTPPEYVRAVLERIQQTFWFTADLHILDPGAGEGVWGIEARKLFPEAFIAGTEIRNLPKPAAYDEWYITPFKHFPEVCPVTFDLIIGNPPFSKVYEFIDPALALLNPQGGVLSYLLRLAFLESKKRFDKYYSRTDSLKPSHVWVSTRRLSFTGNKKSDDTAYAQYTWNIPRSHNTLLDWLDWNYDD